MQPPTVGRIVHVYATEFGSQPLPAIVTFVHQDGSGQVDASLVRRSSDPSAKNLLGMERVTVNDHPPTPEKLAVNPVWVCWPSITSSAPPAIVRIKDEDDEPILVEFNIDFMACEVHESWRAAADRTYSPFNKPWEELSEQARRHISRQARKVMELSIGAMEPIPGVEFTINDAYAEMSDGPAPEMTATHPATPTGDGSAD